MRRTLASVITGTGLFLLSALSAFAQCTVITTLPVTLSLSGAYCLQSDVGTLSNSGVAIDITADGVVLDLGGFRLIGPGTDPTRTIFGIRAQSSKRVTIRNGTVQGFFNGIVLGSQGAGSDYLVENIMAAGNALSGIFVSGSNVIVRNNRIFDTGGAAQPAAVRAIGVSDTVSAVIHDNFLAGATATGKASGIWLQGASRTVIRGNTITGIEGGQSAFGVEVTVSQAVEISGNRILNDASATNLAGIGEPISGSSNIGCYGNRVSGYGAAVNQVCTDAEDNRLF